MTGTWTATAKGAYTDGTTTTGSMTFSLEPSCLSVSSVPVDCKDMGNAFTAGGWSKVTCAPGNNGKCDCSASAEQMGGIGVVSAWADKSGTFTTSGDTLNADDFVDYSYCVSGDTLTLIPKPTILPLTGTVVLKRSGSSGSGGAGGSGAGGAGAGGNGGAGGATGVSVGGATGAGGGAGGAGGKTGAGGASTGSGGGAGASTGGATGAGGKTGAGGGTSPTGGSGGGSSGTAPCDIYESANNKCVAAHSTVRALYSSYNGALYEVKRASDKTTKDIGLLAPGGVADSSVQDTFCANTTCVITRVYDQSGNGNFVEAETADSTVGGNKGQSASNAAQEALTLGGHKVYSLYLKTAQAYWRDGSKSAMPLGKNPQGIYMVTSGKHFGSGCCFDYGNGPTSRTMSGGGTMDALNFSSCTIWGTGAGAGPWVMADLEGGLFAQGGGGKNNNVPSMTSTYVTAVEKNNGTTEFALRGADATTGNLSTFYKGSLPAGYNPMKKQGALILGSGGDCCYSNTTMSQGTFYEGAIVAGYPSDATEDAIQANIVGAGYGK